MQLADTSAKGQGRLLGFIARHRVTVYFVCTFAISWGGALVVAAPEWMHGHSLPKMTGLMMFPVMLLGPSVTGVALTRILGGEEALKKLFGEMRRARVGRWYAGLLIPPGVILLVLIALAACVSPVYAPNKFFIGVSFGVLAGFLEEIGWTGFATRTLLARGAGFSGAVMIGVFWGCWHLPVIDFLGTAWPHGSYLLAYFFAFVAVMTAMRVLIAWLYANTRSVLLAQLMHVSSTGSLVALSPPMATARQEAFWYCIYAGVLWVVVAFVMFRNGASLKLKQNPSDVDCRTDVPPLHLTQE